MKISLVNGSFINACGPHDTGGRVGVKKEQQIDSTLGAAASAVAEAVARRQ